MNKKQIWQKVHDLKDKKGLGRNEISRRLNIPKTTVSRILKEEPKETFKCKECGKVFVPSKFYPNQQFCCDHCKKIYWRKRYKRVGLNKKVVLTCQHCGHLFYADRKAVKYCSRKCYLDEVYGH